MKKTLILLALLPLLVVSLSAFISAQAYNCPMGGGMMYGLYGGYGGGMMIFAWILYILVIVLIGAAVYWLIKSANKNKSK